MTLKAFQVMGSHYHEATRSMPLYTHVMVSLGFGIRSREVGVGDFQAELVVSFESESKSGIQELVG